MSPSINQCPQIPVNLLPLRGCHIFLDWFLFGWVDINTEVKLYQQSLFPCSHFILCCPWIFRETAPALDYKAKTSLLQGLQHRHFFPRAGLRVLDCECQHLQKMPSCFRMCVLFTCRLQLVATVGFSQAVCWGKASLCYRDETASVLLVGTSWLVLLPWDLPSGQEKPQKQSQKGEGVSGVNVHERCCHSQCWCIQCLCPPWSGTSDGTGEDK